jgi:hypothetical protein
MRGSSYDCVEMEDLCMIGGRMWLVLNLNFAGGTNDDVEVAHRKRLFSALTFYSKPPSPPRRSSSTILNKKEKGKSKENLHKRNQAPTRQGSHYYWLKESIIY